MHEILRTFYWGRFQVQLFLFSSELKVAAAHPAHRDEALQPEWIHVCLLFEMNPSQLKQRAANHLTSSQ